MEENVKYKILIVDDSAINRSILADILENKFTILEACNGVEAIQMIKQYERELSLILLDLVMPDMDGLEVLASMNRCDWINDIPVIMISSENLPTYVERAYELGATDFISRPFNVFVVRKRIANTIMLYSKQRSLINLVSQQVYEKEKNNDLMINILSHIVEFRNGESGLHILHVNTITEALLKRLIQKTDRYNLTYADIENIVTASSLHDIGKISVPDEILNKPGRLTPEEFEVIKGHSAAGAEMLNSMTEYLNEPLIITAQQICMYHHERYDGRGYPTGAVGDEIPISAQVVAIADVYDALTSVRCYKDALSHRVAMEMIQNGECGCFNPILLECLADVGGFLERELKINSLSKRNLREIKKMTDEMLSQNKFSAAANSINQLEQARIKYEFFASMSQEVQWEYTEALSILKISEWCAEKFKLPLVILNPFEDTRVLDIIGGKSAEEMFDREIKKTSPESPVAQFIMKLKSDGQMRHYRVYCRVSWSGDDEPKITGTIGKMIDIEEEYQQMRALERQAAVDLLTDVYNHGHAEKLARAMLADHKHKYALIIFDIDNFKTANDTYGHMFGDQVLKTVAGTLTANACHDDIVARIGGDEFLIFIQYQTEAALRANLEMFSARINEICYQGYRVQSSIGVATTKQVGYDYNKLFVCADSALYRSKENGKGTYTFYDESVKLMDFKMTPIEN